MTTTVLTPELKAELAALDSSGLASANVEPSDISQVTVDDSVIDVSEIEDPSDAEFLQKVGHEILLVDAKADFVIKKVVNEIKARASLTKGRLIHEIQVRFGSLDPDAPSKPGLIRYWHSLGFWLPAWQKQFNFEKPQNHIGYNTAMSWANAYRSTLEFQDVFAGLVDDSQAILSASDTVLALMQSLPTSQRIEMMADVAEGQVPSVDEVREIIKQPETQKSLAEEALARVRAKKAQQQAKYEEIKADPNISHTDPEYQQAATNVSRSSKAETKYLQRISSLEEEITLLKAERIKEQKAVQEAKAKEAEALAAQEAAQNELQQLKHDDDSTRRRRITTLSQSLTASVPDVLSDLQKFFAEFEHYELSTREAIDDAAKALYVYLQLRYESTEKTKKATKA